MKGKITFVTNKAMIASFPSRAKLTGRGKWLNSLMLWILTVFLRMRRLKVNLCRPFSKQLIGLNPYLDRKPNIIRLFYLIFPRWVKSGKLFMSLPVVFIWKAFFLNILGFFLDCINTFMIKADKHLIQDQGKYNEWLLIYPTFLYKKLTVTFRVRTGLFWDWWNRTMIGKIPVSLPKLKWLIWTLNFVRWVITQGFG